MNIPARLNRVRSAPLLSRRAGIEAALIVGVYVFYSWVRGSIAGRESEALSRGLSVVRMEQWLNLYHEQALQGSLLHWPRLIEIFNLIYSFLHLPPLLFLALWSFHVNPRKYTLLRTVFLLSAAFGLALFWLFPTAPPRLLPGSLGFVDTLASYGPFSLYHSGSSGLVNQYAAIPSLHFAWAVLVAAGIAWLLEWRWYGVIFAIGWPIIILLTIAVTANHYFFDAFLGLLVVATSLVVALKLWNYVDDHLCTRPFFGRCRRCSARG